MGVPRELFFAGIEPELVSSGHKIATVRVIRDGKNDFTPREQVMGLFPDGKLPLVILQRVDRPVHLMPGGLLLGDGYTNPIAAEEDLKRVPDPQYAQDINAGNPMRGILFTSPQVFERISPIGKHYLTQGNPDEVLQFKDTDSGQPHLRNFLFSSWAYWILDYHRQSPEEFAFALLAYDIIGPGQHEQLLNTYRLAKRARNKNRKAELMRDFRLGFGSS